MAEQDKAKVAYKCLLCMEREGDITLFLMMTNYISDSALAIEILKLCITFPNERWLLASKVQDPSGSTAFSRIAQCQEDQVFIFLSNETYKKADDQNYISVLLLANNEGLNTVHTVARYRKAGAVLYLLSRLTPAQINRLLPLQTNYGETCLSLVIKHQDSETLLQLLKLVSPAALCAALPKQVESLVILKSLVKERSPATLELLETKTGLIKKCQEIQQGFKEVVTDLVSGNCTLAVLKKHDELIIELAKIQTHFGAVEEGSQDYLVTQELNKANGELAKLVGILRRAIDQNQTITSEESEALEGFFVLVFSNNVDDGKDSKIITWEFPLSSCIANVMCAALQDPVCKTKANNLQFVWQNAKINVNAWRTTDSFF